MFVADTNVLVYAVDTDAEHHRACRSRLEGWRRQAIPWYLTWSVVYEFLRIVTHPRVLTRPMPATEAWRFIAAVLAAPAASLLLPTRRHAEVLAASIGDVPGLGGNLVHDLHTAVLMREHGIRRVITRDTDFHRFGWVEVIDPLEA